MNKKFISVIWGYHNQIFRFDKKQNYHMLPLDVMKEEGFECEIFAIDSQVKIENDPNFIKGVKVIYYKNIFQYLFYLSKNRNEIIYSNSLTIKTLLVGIIGKKTFFYPHSYPFGNTIIKNIIINFFYKYFSKIRINNIDEEKKINTIKNNLAFICPLVISEGFYVDNIVDRTGGIWIGNLTNIKNPEFLIETMNILKDKNIIFKIGIVGEDRYNKSGKNFYDLVIDNNLEEYFIFYGVLTYNEIKIKLKESLIYINTSISEGQCLAVYEGALSGNILCLQNIMAFPSVFSNNALYHNNPENLAKNIIQILNNKYDYYQLIENNQKMILSKYNYDNIKIKLRELFLSI